MFAKRAFATPILMSMKTEKHPQTIAIVDDDPRVLESLGELLESAGYSVRLFSSAAAFISADSAKKVDVLICDIRMPGMDGVALQNLMAVERPKLPVILITASTDVHLPGTARPNNRGVFRKPVDASELLATIEAAFAKRA